MLEPDTERLGADSTEWPLRGEILSHVDRIRTSLRVDDIPRQRAPVRQRGARGASRAAQSRRPRPNSGQQSRLRPDKVRAAITKRNW